MSVALIPSQAASDSRGRLGHAAQHGSSRATGQQLYRPDDALGAMLHAPSETVKSGITSSRIVTLPSLGPIAIVVVPRRETAARSAGQAGRCDVGGQRGACRGEGLVDPGTLRVHCLLVAAQLR